MRILLCNLSNDLFEDSRQRLNRSAAKFGIQNIESTKFSDLETSDFYQSNYKILTQSKGIGYWLWKPYIILEAMKKLNDDDIVIYSDCGIEIIADLDPLIQLCQQQKDILLFANSNASNRMWTKRDCFVLMNCDEKRYWDGVHCDAAFCLFKKTPKSNDFLQQWLEYGSNENIITDLPNISGKQNFPGFIEHRWDQSILSLLAIKHNLEIFRMPTQFGNHYKIPELRIAREFNCLNQSDQTQLDYYYKQPLSNSLYPQLLNHHRKKNILVESHENLVDQNINMDIKRSKISKIKDYAKRALKKFTFEGKK